MRTILMAAAVGAATLVSGCASNRPAPTEHEVAALGASAEVAFDDLEKQFPWVRRRAREAHAYAIFPNVTKGAAGIGGAAGDGLVYRRGDLIGTVRMSQVSVGAQIGGSSFRELILFEDERALRRLIVGEMEASANASAVAGDNGAAAANDYNDGVAVYVVAVGGLLLDASIGTQDFDFDYLD